MNFCLKTLIPAAVSGSLLLCGCADSKDVNIPEAEEMSYSDFAVYTLNSAVLFSFGEDGSLNEDEVRETGFNSIFQNDFLKYSDRSWYTSSSSRIPGQPSIIRISDTSLNAVRFDPLKEPYTAAGPYHDTMLYAMSSINEYKLTQFDRSFEKIAEKKYEHEEQMFTVHDICEWMDHILLLISDESLNQWVQVLDSELNEVNVYPKPAELGTLLRMCTDGPRVWLSETSHENDSPANRIISLDPETGTFANKIITLSHAYPYKIRYIEQENSLLIEHEPWSVNDALWTVLDLNTQEETIFSASSLGYSCAEILPAPLAAYGNDGYYYFLAQNTLYRLQAGTGITAEWDLSAYHMDHPHTMIFRKK